MIEFEKKILLSETMYTYLKNHYEPYGKITQHTNYYYDTEKFSLDRINFTLRIREKDGEYIATIKQHTPSPDCNVELSGPVADQYDDSFFNAYQVILHGKLETERLSVYLESGIVIVLDKNDYLGTTDYELEIEYPLGLGQEAYEQLNTIAIMLSESCCMRNEKAFIESSEHAASKSKRFFERLKNLRMEDEEIL